MNSLLHQEDNILSVQDLKKHFPLKKGFWQKTRAWVRAVDNVDFFVPRGKTLGLVGESGCGKSTLARVVLRLLDPDQGSIRFQGREITSLDKKELKQLRKNMQIVFQDPHGSLNPKMQIKSTIEDGLRVSKVPRRERQGRIKTILETVGLTGDCMNRFPHEFSGGQRQRIGLARALSVNPELIVCDEPISSLDVSIQAQIINLLQNLQEELGLSYIFITHDLNVVGYVSDWIAVMYLGQIMEYAPTETLFQNPLHPYTKALLAASPSVRPEQDQTLQTLPGEVPSAFDPPPGCSFQTRCPLGEDKCSESRVKLREINNSHWVRCLKLSKDLNSRSWK